MDKMSNYEAYTVMRMFVRIHEQIKDAWVRQPSGDDACMMSTLCGRLHIHIFGADAVLGDRMIDYKETA